MQPDEIRAEVVDLAKVTLEPGEVLALRMQEEPDPRTMAALEDFLPEDVRGRVIVVGPGTDLMVVKALS